MSNGSSSVYAVTLESTTLGDILTAIDQELEYTLNDPENLVDWSQYKFERLIQNLDAWSTVVLIFVLNILPRVAVLLFFILMLLSLMKDWKPFQMFCHRWFDPFKFLTLGHISVDNVNLKRLLIISLICISLMMVIMDGQLFNFIIWIAKALVAITQR
jgi:predicted PurR-regulated permease PerM